MSGHSKWSKIKHQKGVTDAKKGQVFSKISRLITIAARKGKDPNMNLELKYAISQAKSANMPSTNIDRAIKKGTGEIKGEILEEVQYEAFGPGGSAIMIEVVTDNKNRTLNELKQLFLQHNTKLSTPGSTTWAMKTPIDLSEKDKETVKKLIKILNDHADIQKVHTNSNTGD